MNPKNNFSMRKNRKTKILIIGTGRGDDLKSLTLESCGRIMQAKNIYCRVDYEPIIRELRKKGKKVFSLTSSYEKFNSFKETYEDMARFLIKEAKEKGEVLYLTPGHPFVCEYPTELVVKEAERSGIEIEIFPNLSFLDLLFAEARFEPGVGMQFIAASELFKKKIYDSLSCDLICVISCISNKLQPGREKTVYEKFIEFLNDKYSKDHKINIFYQDPHAWKQKIISAKICSVKKYKEVLTTYRTTCYIFPRRHR